MHAENIIIMIDSLASKAETMDSTYFSVQTKLAKIAGEPRFTKKNINIGDELLYDFGDRRKEANKWLAYHKHSGF